MSRAIDLAKECGAGFYGEAGDPDFEIGLLAAELETFYRRAQMEELEACLLLVQSEALADDLDDDEDRAYNAAIFDAASAIISRKRRMAKEPKAG